MAALSTALLSAVLGLFMYAGMAQPMIRRHEEGMAMHLSSSGEMVKARDPSLEQTQLIHALVSPHESFSQEVDMKEIGETCEDFPLGIENTNNCSGHHQHVPIEQLSQCKEAADRAGAHHVQGQDFQVPADWKDTRPEGCFVTSCSHGIGMCYFYNPIGDSPTNPVGTPVCARPKFLKGTENTNGEGADCPAGYQVIMGEGHCKEARCTGVAAEEVLDRVSEVNNSKHDEFPQGCFEDAISKELLFNGDIQGYGLPQAPVGTPMCIVSNVTKCTSTGCEAVETPELLSEYLSAHANATATATTATAATATATATATDNTTGT